MGAVLGTPVPRIPEVPTRSPGLTATAPEALVREPGRSRLFALPGIPMRSVAGGEGREKGGGVEEGRGPALT